MAIFQVEFVSPVTVNEISFIPDTCSWRRLPHHLMNERCQNAMSNISQGLFSLRSYYGYIGRGWNKISSFFCKENFLFVVLRKTVVKTDYSGKRSTPNRRERKALIWTNRSKNTSGKNFG
ncbi:hypothetical protein CEXT_193991 [Caerostris extrusa]|uniref:Uncharacterized protein n=1 Tax=Caerostris extrusa TaxID=172846 RepID=A0AAV4Q6B2_CAEEX|nr:hypothetical protein CEXT_193991 [Caerostris extrusa]